VDNDGQTTSGTPFELVKTFDTDDSSHAGELVINTSNLNKYAILTRIRGRITVYLPESD
jgi:hypothetical protein